MGKSYGLKLVPYTPFEGIPVRGLLVFLKENYAMDSGWNRNFGDLETFLNFFFIFWPEKIPGHAKIARNITP